MADLRVYTEELMVVRTHWSTGGLKEAQLQRKVLLCWLRQIIGKTRANVLGH